jgi:DNA-binding CsgD family transcriptional regulator
MRFWLLEELQAALETAALDAPLAIVLDDLHWADAGTLTAVQTLAPRMAGLPILWVLAMRPGEARPQAGQIIERLGRAGVRRLVLRPLEADAVAAVAHDRLGAAAGPELLDLAASVRGNPFWLVELLEGLHQEDRLTAADDVLTLCGTELPARLAETMRQRLSRLSEETCAVVRVAAVLGRRFTAEQLAAMLDRKPSQLLAPLEEALLADLLTEAGERLSFRHDILRQAVLRTLPSSVRRGLQREVAAMLLEVGAAPVEVAAQLADSAEVGDVIAIAKLREAAQDLRATDAGAAADMSMRALELTPHRDASRASVVAETLVLLHAAMRHDDAARLADVAMDGVLTTQQEAEVRLSLSAMIMRSAPWRIDHNRRALRLAGVSQGLRVMHRAWLAYSLGGAGHVAEAEAEAAPALQEALDGGDPQAASLAEVALAAIETQRGDLGQALRRIQAASEGCRRRDDDVPSALVEYYRAAALVGVGRVAEATAIQRNGLARGQHMRQAFLVHGWVAYGSTMHLAAGRLVDARADAEAAESMALSELPTHLPALSAMLTRFEVALRTGDLQAMRASVAAARRMLREGGGPSARRHASWILALAAMSAGDAKRAVGWLDDDELPYGVPFLPADPSVHPRVVRIALAAGDGELAARALAAAERTEQGSPGVAHIAGFTAHARGLVHRDAGELLHAVELQRGSELPIPLASTLEDAGSALVAEGKVCDGVALLGEALDGWLAIGATADARRAGRRLRRHGVRRRLSAATRPSHGWESLTESELRVARLVGAGATNRDAAERLFLSPHTVSSHLRQAFAKLAINSRIELAHIVAEQEG